MAKRHIFILLVASSLLPGYLRGQKWTKESTVKLDQPVTSFSVDTEGNFYLGFQNGSLKKYDSQGDDSPLFSIPNQSAIGLVEAQNNRKIFLFYPDIQQITILDRFSSIPKNYQLRDFEVYFGISACPTPDGGIWVVENNPQRLKKIDLLRKSVVFEVQHELGDSIKFMRTYQNLLLIIDENALNVLDQFGNLINSMEIENLIYAQILEDNVIASKYSELIRVDPYQSKVLERTKIPTTESKGVLLLKEKYVLINERSFTFYSWSKY